MDTIPNKMHVARSIGILIFICLVCLVPFYNKAFHIDDPLFLWAAKQIQANPFDPFGFRVNWYGLVMPMSEVTQNPPLASYYIAVVATLFGWSEPTLHLSFWLPVCTVIAATYILALQLCDRPMFATLASFFTPVFLVSSTTVMCDMLMLSLWMFSVVFWIHGMKTDSGASLLIASLCIAACCLTKYFGVCLIPLLCAYSYSKKRTIGIWIIFLCIPVAVLTGYQLMTKQMYGSGLFLNAASYASSFRFLTAASFDPTVSPKNTLIADVMYKIVTGLAFTGGCLTLSFFYPLVLTSKKNSIICIALISLCLVSLLPYGVFDNDHLATDAGINWLLAIQIPLFVYGGAWFIYVVVADLLKQRDAESLLLFAWAIGTICFAVFINWSVNGRTLLPLAPIAGILIARHFGKVHGIAAGSGDYLFYAPLIPTILVALLVSHADYLYANSARAAALTLQNKYRQSSGTLWFQGHWGFQYYMQLYGWRPMDYTNPQLRKGDTVAIPAMSTGTKMLYKHMAELAGQYEFKGSSTVATMNRNLGAGFYVDKIGMLPFSFGNDSRQIYYTYRITRDKLTKFTY